METEVVQSRGRCWGCSKRTGLDEFVENALRRGIHNREPSSPWDRAKIRENARQARFYILYVVVKRDRGREGEREARSQSRDSQSKIVEESSIPQRMCSCSLHM